MKYQAFLAVMILFFATPLYANNESSITFSGHEIHFNDVYEAAKALDSNKLEGLKFYINENPKGKDQTAAEKLAEEGNFEAVSLLMRYGASINQIARGFARGKHLQYAVYMQDTWDVDPAGVVEGAAEAGSFDFVLETLASLEHDEYQLYWSAEAAAKGAARGGHTEFAERISKKYKVIPGHLAVGALQGKQYDYYYQLYDSFQADESDKKYILWSPVNDYTAFSGDEHYKLDLEHSSSKSIAREMLQGGRFEAALPYVQDWLSSTIDLEVIIGSAAYRGHVDYCEEAREKGWLDGTSYDFDAAEGFHIHYAAYIANKKRNDRNVAGMVYDYYARSPRNLMYFFLIVDEEKVKPYLDIIIEEAKNDARYGKKLDSVIQNPEAYLEEITRLRNKPDVFNFPRLSDQ